MAGAPPAVQTMYDRSGKAVEVAADQVADAYRSGQFGFGEGAPVYLRRGRDTVAMSGDEAASLLSSHEGRFYDGGSAAGFEDQELSKEYGGFGGQAKAFAAGAGRALSFGLSDVALSELGGEDTRQDLARLQKYNPGASMAGEIGRAHV